MTSQQTRGSRLRRERATCSLAIDSSPSTHAYAKRRKEYRRSKLHWPLWTQHFVESSSCVVRTISKISQRLSTVAATVLRQLRNVSFVRWRLRLFCPRCLVALVYASVWSCFLNVFLRKEKTRRLKINLSRFSAPCSAFSQLRNFSNDFSNFKHFVDQSEKTFEISNILRPDNFEPHAYLKLAILRTILPIHSLPKLIWICFNSRTIE